MIETLKKVDRTTLFLGTLAILIIMNLVSFTFMGIDKRRAQRGAWRISEKTLLLTTAIFGGLGGVLGMRIFRHKTKHWYFKAFFPLLLGLQTVLLITATYYMLHS